MTKHLSTVSFDLPTKDGTPLRATLHQDEEIPGNGYSDNSILTFGEHVSYGLRPLVSYRVASLLAVRGSLTLHDQCPGLTVERHWLITLTDWVIMMTEESAVTRESTS